MRDHKHAKELTYWDVMSHRYQEYVLTGRTHLFVLAERLPEVFGRPTPS